MPTTRVLAALLALVAAPAAPAGAEGPPVAVFLGSSTTAGVGATRADRRWATLLCRHLGWREINQGLAGSAMLTRADGPGPLPMAPYRHMVEAYKPRTAFVMYGANEALYGLPPGPGPSTFQAAATETLGWLGERVARDRVWAVAPQPNRAVAAKRAPFDVALAQAARDRGTRFLPPAGAAFPPDRLGEHLHDDLHLNDLGHARFASHLADALAAAGQVPAPPSAGGPAADGELVPAPGGWSVDVAAPLPPGVVSAVEARWVAPGRARVAIFRPDGRGGFEVLYASSFVDVRPGRMRMSFGGWVLAGDRLAVWTDRPCLGAAASAATAGWHAAGGGAPVDLPAPVGGPSPLRLAVRAVGPAAPGVGLEGSPPG